MTQTEILAGLDYIAHSPPHIFGGFSPATVELAKAARDEIIRLSLLQRGAVESGETGLVMRSNCCNAPMVVAGGKEGTNWHECTDCKKACDQMPLNE